MVYRPQRCIGCGHCVETCPEKALEAAAAGVVRDRSLCRGCGDCVRCCPAEARESTGWIVSTADLLATIEKDIPFYDQSGGGVTFSGGEPLFQFDFLMAMLKSCRQKEIHSALDTTGFASPEAVAEVSRFTDLFLYDLKLIDPDRHRSFTGHANHLILENLKMLSSSAADITIRIPLIPGINDDADNLQQTADFIAGLPRRHPVELLPFHCGALHKYEKLGLPYPARQLLPPDTNQLSTAAGCFQKAGLTVHTGGGA